MINIPNFFATGLIDLPWWGYIVVTLFLTHITIAAVTIFLHRAQAHRGLDLHAIPSHFFRFWLWLTTGQVTKEWVSIHRKHHAKCETEEDPHSPVTRGIKKVLFEGAELYRAESKNLETMQKYGHGTPDDWMERNVYSRFSWQGVALMGGLGNSGASGRWRIGTIGSNATTQWPAPGSRKKSGAAPFPHEMAPGMRGSMIPT